MGDRGRRCILAFIRDEGAMDLQSNFVPFIGEEGCPVILITTPNSPSAESNSIQSFGTGYKKAGDDFLQRHRMTPLLSGFRYSECPHGANFTDEM